MAATQKLLNGLLDQGYWPEGLYTPPSDAAVERELSEVTLY